MRTVRVELGERAYEIQIGGGARREVASWLSGLNRKRQVVIISDRAVAERHIETLKAALPATPEAVLTFAPGEASKSLAGVAPLYEQLAGARIDRDAVIIAFGGGVAGDLGGFVAATWLRGVDFVQVPTTLLAAVDASVGGKTGVNIAAGKNLVGAFHQPRLVVVDTDFLATLPEREFVSGLAESVKHAAIRDPEFLSWHEVHAAEIIARVPEVVSELIARNCAIKAAVVGADERESGLRAILNHGHTVGHALEHVLGYELRHGECVALGMIVENELACRRGWLGMSDAARIRALLARFGLPASVPAGVAAADVIAGTRVDKKNRAGAANYVLLRALGKPVRVGDVADSDVEAALARAPE